MESGEPTNIVSGDSPEARERAWLSSVMIGDYPGLGGEVTIELSPRCTVLVGRNATGKSLILDALMGASLTLRTGSSQSRKVPERFHCTLESSARSMHLSYSRKRKSRRSPSAAGNGGLTTDEVSYEEKCWSVEGGSSRELWRVSRGKITTAGGDTYATAPNLGRIASIQRADPEELPEDYPLLRQIDDALWFHSVTAGVPRESGIRREIFLRATRQVDGGSVDDARDRLDLLAASLILSEGSPTFDRIVSAARRMGIVESIKVVRYGNVMATNDDSGEPPSEHIAEVQVDGVNIGLLSDGTSRSLEIIEELTKYPYPLLLEEPETGIHPGLLARLLHELESYEGQVIISTHSPQVVSWAKPEEIRLVERSEGKTTVRGLTPHEIERVHEYLSHDGTLGEFVYGGALDGED